MTDFEQRLLQGDLTLFDGIHAQMDAADKNSVLALQAGLRSLAEGYQYLEIGSHLGGSIQTHLLDPKCGGIVSIDLRPKIQPDARGRASRYPANSTEAMLDNLRALAPGQLDKITTFDCDASTVSSEQLPEAPHACFIDGEHTDDAAIRDFETCFRLMRKPGVVYFHDAHVVYNGIHEVVRKLKYTNQPFTAYALPTSVFVIEIGDFPLHETPQVKELLFNNYRVYLPSMRMMDVYRRFYNIAPFRIPRDIVRRMVRFRSRKSPNL